jgi:excisionase family DNA binding protein
MSESIKSDWMDVEEAAKYIGIGLSNLYALAQGGKIPSNKVGKIWKFNKGDLDYMDSGQQASGGVFHNYSN